MTRVLIIDNHPSSLTRHKAMVSAVGYEVVGEATAGKVGVMLARTLGVDAILLGVGLPNMKGMDVAGEIMKVRPIPIICVANDYDAGTIDRAKAVGVMAVLINPVDEPQLQAIMEISMARFRECTLLQAENFKLKETLQGRKLIERAKGVLMEQRRLSEEQAYNLIKKNSMNLRRPMADVAQAILLSHGLLSQPPE